MKVEIRNHLIYVDSQKVTQRPTRNHSGQMPERVAAIVIHDTAGWPHGNEAVDWLAGGPGMSQNSSAHVVIHYDGRITQLAPLNYKCWHAGPSSWRGRQNLNNWSIGIEISNPGGPLVVLGNKRYRGAVPIDLNKNPEYQVAHAKFPPETGDGRPVPANDGTWLKFSDAQIASVTALCRAIVATYPSVKDLVGHWQICPGRKVDPNPTFPWSEFRRLVLPAQVAAAGEDDGEVVARADDGNSDDDTTTVARADDGDGGDETGQGAVQTLMGDGHVDEPEPTKEEVAYIQRALRDKGYFQVGAPDGDFGDWTKGAIRTFRGERGLPPEPLIDAALYQELARAPNRVIGDARAKATAKDISDRVPEAKAFSLQKVWAWVCGLLVSGWAAVQAFFLELAKLPTPVLILIGFMFVVIIIAIGVLLWLSSRGQKSVVGAWQEGRRL